MNFVAIIPARFASTRFPGKPLADMLGKPMIQRVYEQVKKSVADVYVATDDERIYAAVEKFGGKAIMTNNNHKSGTDRCYEAYTKIGTPFDVIINIQGDEPFIQIEQIEAIKNCFSDAITEIATLVKPFTEENTIQELQNVNSPKVVLNKRSEALYFSRSVIPFQRGKNTEDWLKTKTAYYKHIGMYAYRANILREITQLEQTPLELAESLEQLRWIENGYRIKVGITTQETIGIDTPEDMEKAISFLKNQK